MQIKMGRLRGMLSEQAISRLLTEEDDSLSHETGTSGDSVDSQVDRYFGQYEADAKKSDEPSIDQMESLDWRDLCKGTVLLTEEGQGDKDAEETPDEEAPGADDLTGEDTGKLGMDTLDVEKFANSVVRMIQNYDSLLEIRSTLMRRASTFLKKTYDDQVLQAFEDVLRDDHGMEAGADKRDIDADRFPAPAADRANGSAAPGAGGSGPPG
jgi:hypothetical protein